MSPARIANLRAELARKDEALQRLAEDTIAKVDVARRALAEPTGEKE